MTCTTTALPQLSARSPRSISPSEDRNDPETDTQTDVPLASTGTFPPRSTSRRDDEPDVGGSSSPAGSADCRGPEAILLADRVIVLTDGRRAVDIPVDVANPIRS